MRVSMINDIGKYCACQAAMKIQYTKLTTSTNDPKMSKKMSFVVKLQRPVCRTAIKPVQEHRNVVKYDRKNAKKAILSSITELGAKNVTKY